MSMEGEIISVLQTRKDQIENEVTIIRKGIKENFELVIKNLNDIIKDGRNIINLDLNNLNSIIPNIDTLLIKKYAFFKVIASSESLSFDEEQRKYLTSSAKTLLDEIDKEVRKRIDSDRILLEKKKLLLEIDSIIEKISNLEKGSYLGEKEFLIIRDVFDGSNLSTQEKIDIVSYLTITSLKNLSNLGIEEQEEEIEEVKITNLDNEEVKALFKKYHYDFTSFNDKAQKLILKYGNIENMEGILEVLKEVKIDIATYSGQFSSVLTLSNREIVTNILNNIRSDFSQGNVVLSNIFLNYLSHPSIFISSKKHYESLTRTSRMERENDEKKSGTRKNYSVLGGYDNYRKNREFFIRLGVVDINTAIERCGSTFTISHELVKKRASAFDFYKIPREVYLSALSSFSSTTALDTIDKFIEVGCYDYIINNFSQVTISPNASLFYRIVRAKQLGQTNLDIYRGYKNGNQGRGKIELRGVISNDKLKGFDIDRTNGETVVGRYLPQFRSSYDDIIEKNDNSGPIILAIRNFFIRKLEDNYKRDEFTYDFNGIIISRYKVLRLYETLMQNALAGSIESVMYVICKNSILTLEEYKTIKNCVDMLFKEVRGVVR